MFYQSLFLFIVVKATTFNFVDKDGQLLKQFKYILGNICSSALSLLLEQGNSTV